MTPQGTIRGLNKYTGKDIPGEELRSALLLEGLGMEGDCHAQGGIRQLSLLSVEDRQWMAARMEYSAAQEAIQPVGLCFARYRENILFEGLAPDSLVPGTRLLIGECSQSPVPSPQSPIKGAILEISAETKRCFEQCSLFSQGQCCILAGRSPFAVVIRGGMVSVGDSINIIA